MVVDLASFVIRRVSEVSFNNISLFFAFRIPGLGIYLIPFLYSALSLGKVSKWESFVSIFY